ncbi:MAG: bifunctional DNA-binding transcriptional regulator/O6-methylguanine-DNA methyltransferase Ada, partial [Nitrosomonadales bacterium]|nr:bifunctional DNA-binding transcriptional regulator/O6-methylguanine-DNA methyltransferase Ada [Nitrosomonadales bacterium]
MDAYNTENDPRWQRVISKEQSPETGFYYAVKTTGVYCRPSCPSRLPRPENVAFYDTIEAAELAGYRPCKRCNPNQQSLAQQHATLIAKACRQIENSENELNLDQLAELVGLSAYYFHRLFKSITGLTPKAYMTAFRAIRIRANLQEDSSITEAIFNAGYNANSRFYEKSNEILGMTPSHYKAGGLNIKIRFAVGQCSLGEILVAASHLGICAILLGDDPESLLQDLQDRFPKSQLIGADRDFEAWVAHVVGFIESPAIGLDLPLDIRGTAFQQRVWQALREIPAGSTASYSTIAERIGAPKAVRAVAGACAANTLAVAIPCHRVV